MPVTDKATASTAATAATESITRLESLGAELDRAGWRTRLVTEPGRLPTLHVQNPQPGTAMLSEDIYCAPRGDTWTYWRSWAEPICADIAEAAAIISKVLRAAEPARTWRQPVTGTAAELSPLASPPRMFQRLQAPRPPSQRSSTRDSKATSTADQVRACAGQAFLPWRSGQCVGQFCDARITRMAGLQVGVELSEHPGQPY